MSSTRTTCAAMTNVTLEPVSTAVVATEFAGDGDQTRRPGRDQCQRPGQRGDVAVEAEQRAGDDRQHQREHGDADHDRPLASRCTIVPM